MKNKSTWIILGILIITLISLFWTRSMNEDSWICAETGWIEHGRPNFTKPIIPCSKMEKEQAVEKYLKENISNISPTKEVLGGKFYITKTDWVGNNSGIVEYEDGHILLKAFFGYEIQINNQNNNYSVIINNFKIIE